MIASFNQDDMAFGFGELTAASTVADYRAAAQKLFGADAAQFLKLYPVKQDSEVRVVARGAAQDAGLAASSRGCASDLAALGVPVWIDQYSRRHPYVPGLVLADQDTATVGAYHTADIPYWFGTQDNYNAIRPTRNWTAWDRELSGKMMRALIAMAETGSPDTPAMPWQPWSARNDSLIDFGDAVTTRKVNVPGQTWLAQHKPAASSVPRPGGPRD